MRFLFASLGLLVAATGTPAADTVRVEAAHLRFTVPATWTRVPATGETEAARYRLPPSGRDQGDTEIVLRTSSGAGDDIADAQVERWNARFTQSDGQPSRAAAAVLRRKLDALRITRADVGGTYVGSASGAIRAGVSGYRLLGAVVEGDGGPWVFELLGPKTTVGDARADFDALLFSLELHP